MMQTLAMHLLTFYMRECQLLQWCLKKRTNAKLLLQHGRFYSLDGFKYYLPWNVMFKSIFLKITSNAKYFTGVSYYMETLLCNLFFFVIEISYFANGIFTLVYSLYFFCCTL